MRLSDLSIGDMIQTGDGYRFICVPSDAGNVITDGDLTYPCDGSLSTGGGPDGTSPDEGTPYFDPAWRLISPEEVGPDDLPVYLALLEEAERRDEPDAIVGRHESDIRRSFRLTVVDMNEEGTAYLGTHDAVERFVNCLGCIIGERDAHGHWEEVTLADGTRLGQIDIAPSGEGWIFSALNEPLAKLLESSD